MYILSVYYKVGFSLITAFFLISCGVAERGSRPDTGRATSISESPELPMAANVSKVDNVSEQLWGAHQEWEGTPYILGGNGINGVDCSSFTQIVYRDYFGEDLPRNTRSQLQEGSGVRRNSIRPGDLIFFRTARGVLHVGIAMEEGDFLHASTSSGVMISNLGERYWSARYLGARRIL